jgi:hypothetical protein
MYHTVTLCQDKNVLLCIEQLGAFFHSGIHNICGALDPCPGGIALHCLGGVSGGIFAGFEGGIVV